MTCLHQKIFLSAPITAIRGFDMGAQMQQPLAVAVIGGFVVGLPLLLAVLPALMRRIYR